MPKETEIITKMLAHITGECNAINSEKAYDAMIDECYSFKSVGGPFEYMSPSRVLAECMPTDYRCGLVDYVDSQSDCWVEIGGEHYETHAVDEAKEEFIDELRAELTKLESSYEGTDVTDTDELNRLERELDDKKAEIEACEDHSF